MTRGSASLARRTREREAAGLPFKPMQPANAEHYVPPQRLHGRVILALVDGPMLATELAAKCGVTLDDLDDAAARLRVDCEALVAGNDRLVGLRWGPSFGGVVGWMAAREKREIAA